MRQNFTLTLHPPHVLPCNDLCAVTMHTSSRPSQRPSSATMQYGRAVGRLADDDMCQQPKDPKADEFRKILPKCSSPRQ